MCHRLSYYIDVHLPLESLVIQSAICISVNPSANGFCSSSTWNSLYELWSGLDTPYTFATAGRRPVTF